MAYNDGELLHWAGIADNTISEIKRVIEKNPQSIYDLDLYNDNCLIIAAQQNNIENVKFLLTLKEIDINYVGGSGTAFHTALKKNYQEIIEILFYNTDLNLKVFHNEELTINIALKYDLWSYIGKFLEKNPELLYMHQNTFKKSFLSTFLEMYSHKVDYLIFQCNILPFWKESMLDLSIKDGGNIKDYLKNLYQKNNDIKFPLMDMNVL